MKISIQNRDKPLVAQLCLRTCERFLDRLRGLMFHPPLRDDDGILLVQKRDSRMEAAIHMLFMRTDLTVVWVNSDMRVVDLKLAKRWHPSYVPQKPARYVLELSPSRISDFSIGDRLVFEEITN
jgi:uncharacterized membrane protein (UPF0127 family)